MSNTPYFFKSIISTAAICTYVLLPFQRLYGQPGPEIKIAYSGLLATYNFVQKLSDNYPANALKKRFDSSDFNRQPYTGLIKQFDSLNIYESYSFQGYPTGQKATVTTIALIKKNLISSGSLEEFNNKTFGIIPNDKLLTLTRILSAFKPVYDSLIYYPNQNGINNQLQSLQQYVRQSNLSALFEKDLIFYGVKWDNSIPITITIIPLFGSEGFSANAFLNTAVSEVPLNYKHNDILFSVVMHEICHIIYNEQSLSFKNRMQSWFNHHASKNSQYACLLFNEVLATDLGNGYVYKQLNGQTEKGDWYNNKYINLMAKKLYPSVENYLASGKTIDSTFISNYINIYDANFPDWINELSNLFTYRYVLSENQDNFNFFRKAFPYSSFYKYDTEFSSCSLEQLKETPVTKIIIISSDHKNKLQQITNTFPELKNRKYMANKAFIDSIGLADKTKLFIINQVATSLQDLFDKNFDNTPTK